MSIVGTRIGRPSIRPSKVTLGRASRTSVMSALVPPMSSVMTSRKPAWDAMNAAPTAPAAGPDRTTLMACSRAA
jgi:hypothetical protein